MAFTFGVETNEGGVVTGGGATDVGCLFALEADGLSFGIQF